MYCHCVSSDRATRPEAWVPEYGCFLLEHCDGDGVVNGDILWSLLTQGKHVLCFLVVDSTQMIHLRSFIQQIFVCLLRFPSHRAGPCGSWDSWGRSKADTVFCPSCAHLFLTQRFLMGSDCGTLCRRLSDFGLGAGEWLP